jgi:pimeloyl-ACP methyl ester carboxylesterase
VPYDGGVDLYLRWDANQSYAGFSECFANGVDRDEAAVLFATQRPAAPAQFAEPSGPPAWKTIPTWSLIGTKDHVIPQPLQEEMSGRAGAHVTRLDAGHLSLITNPGDVTRVILAAVDAAA